MDPPRLICIVGPDGTGKTTQAKMLIEKLSEMGYEYEYRWMRFHHFTSLPVLGLARILGLTEVQTLPNGKKIGYHHFYRSKLISVIYPITLYIDTFLASALKVYIPLRLRKKRIICDRFIYDTLVDLAVDMNNPKILDSKIAKKFLKLIPRDCLMILLLAPYERIKERREDLEFDRSLEKRIEIYRKLCERFPQIIKIDASLDIDRIHKQILDIVVSTNENIKNPS